MNRPPEPWYRNPFLLGTAGLLLLVGGYIALSSALGEQSASPLYVGGRLAFLAGLITVLAAAAVWFFDARQPEPNAEDEDLPEDEIPPDESYF